MTKFRTAVNAKCRECIYDPAPGNGNWRQQVEACTALTCPLWPLRPVSTPKHSETPHSLPMTTPTRGWLK